MGMPETNVQQFPQLMPPPIQEVQIYQSATLQQKSQWSFEQKSKDTILFIGETFGWGTLLVFIITGSLLRKKIVSLFVTLTKKVV